MTACMHDLLHPFHAGLSHQPYRFSCQSHTHDRPHPPHVLLCMSCSQASHTEPTPTNAPTHLYDPNTLILRPYKYSYPDQHTALCTVLQQLSALQAPGITIRLVRWRWTHPMALSLAAALPALPHLQFSLRLESLTNELLGVALAMGPCVRGLHVGSLHLQTNTHANTPWPWEDVYIGAWPFDVTALLRLPCPVRGGSGSGGGTRRVVRCRDLTINSESLMQVRERVFV